MKNEQINYENIILGFLKKYKRKHGTKKTMLLMEDIINKRNIDRLPEQLQNISAERLSEELSSIIINQIRSDISGKYDVTPLLPAILKNYKKEDKKEKSSLNKTSFFKNKITKAALIGASAVLLITSKVSVTKKMEAYEPKLSNKSDTFSKQLYIVFSNFQNLKNKNFVLQKNKKPKVRKIAITINKGIKKGVTEEIIPSPTATPTPTPTSTPISNSKTPKEKNQNLSKELNTMLEQVEEKEKPKQIQTDKEKKLNNFKKCKTLDSIFKRQKELENLGLTKKDKLYKDCKLSAPLQRFIYEQSVTWGITSTDFTFSIVDTETRGGFGSSGSKSVNGPGDYDLGLTQQNTKSSVTSFAKAYHISYDKACKLIQHNDYVNVVSACLEYQEIARFNGNKFDPVQYAGCYNGWLRWRQKAVSRYYVKWFKNVYQNKYTKYHKVEKITTKQAKNKIIVKTK